MTQHKSAKTDVLVYSLKIILVPFLNFDFTSWEIHFNPQRAKEYFYEIPPWNCVTTIVFCWINSFILLPWIACANFKFCKIYTDYYQRTCSHVIPVVFLSQVGTLLAPIYQRSHSESSHFQCISFSRSLLSAFVLTETHFYVYSIHFLALFFLMVKVYGCRHWGGRQ